ncbi:MAG: DUF4339 domain-containing protein [Prevotella sp.]|jgi:hypothetical protein|nr:DUF4339 domain-containing protein [Prevotella sp.]
MKYFIVENNKQSGPFSIYELKDKGITSETLVWAEGMTDWTPAWKVDELRAFLFNTKDASTPPPLPEDMEQPAAAPVEPAAAIEKKKPQGSSCLKRMFVGFLFLLAVLLVAMAVSCPSEQAHKNKIKEKITLALEQSAQRNNNLFGVGIGLVRHLLTDEILDRVLDEMVDYHNYYVFSKCTINSDGKDKNISYGAFARVFTMNEDDLSRYIDEHNPLSGFEPATGTQQADTTAGTQIQPADGDLMNDIQEEIIGSLSRIVKKQVGERTDSTTSDAINKIVDGVTDMIRNEVNR